MKKNITFLAILACLLTNTNVALAQSPISSPNRPCRTTEDENKKQYIIGYGSLMEDDSRQRTSPLAANAYPIVIKGFRRGWFQKGSDLGTSTTFLGVLPDHKAMLNAVIFSVSKNELLATDIRESGYCRVLVSDTNISMLKNTLPVPEGQVWIYVTKPEYVKNSSSRFPIVQSYVDLFISGCIEQEQRYNIPGFAKQCIETTTDWSSFWVNDRIYPRRPFIYQPKASQIDRLLNEVIPEFFEKIKIE